MRAGSEEADPIVVARELGITVAECDAVTWRVGSTVDAVFYARSADDRVRRARIWEGIAQCLLTRAGAPWSEDDAVMLAAELKITRKIAI